MSHYVMLAVGRMPGGETGLVGFVGPGEDLRGFVLGNLALMQERWGAPVMVHWAGERGVLDLDSAPELPIELPIDDMMAAAIEGQMVAISTPVAVDLPPEPARGVYFGLIGPGLGGLLQEVAVAARTLAEAAQAVLSEQPEIPQLHGLSDVTLADDGATFSGKPMALAAMFVQQAGPGQVQYGERFGDL